MKLSILILALVFAGCGSFKGERGPAGEAGSQGESGSTGATGATGPAGQDASIETIELCPSIAGDGFNEYLLRIDGQLFGVYASGQRIFLVRLTPGNYASTDGRSCQFTVTNDYQVQ